MVRPQAEVVDACFLQCAHKRVDHTSYSCVRTGLGPTTLGFRPTFFFHRLCELQKPGIGTTPVRVATVFDEAPLCCFMRITLSFATHKAFVCPCVPDRA